MLISDLEHFNSFSVPQKLSGGLLATDLPVLIILPVPAIPILPDGTQPAPTNQTTSATSVSPDGKQAAAAYSSVSTSRYVS